MKYTEAVMCRINIEKHLSRDTRKNPDPNILNTIQGDRQ